MYVIYAQTPKFFIAGGPCVDPTTTSACPLATTTVTQTVYATGSMWSPSPLVILQSFRHTDVSRLDVTVPYSQTASGYAPTGTGNATISGTGQPTFSVVPVSAASSSLHFTHGALLVTVLAALGLVTFF